MLTSSTIGVLLYTFSKYSIAIYSPWESFIRFFFLSIILTTPFGRISPMSPENAKEWKSQHTNVEAFCLTRNDGCLTCMEPPIFHALSCQFWILVITREKSLPSEAYLATRRITKRIVSHLRNLLQAQIIVYSCCPNCTQHAHFIWKGHGGWSTAFGQP